MDSMRSMSWTAGWPTGTVIRMTSELVRSQFGAVADAYVTSSYHASGADLAALVRAAGLTGIEDVLDLGCGAGHAALAMAAGAAHVTAVDVTPDMVATASRFVRERGAENVTVQLADVAELPFGSAQFA